MYKLISILILYTLLPFCKVESQSVIQGSIKNTQQEYISYATIRLLSPDSIFVQGTAADSMGYYRIEKVERGKYLLAVSAIGYQTTIYPFSLDQDETTLPNILLNTASIALSDVEVNAQSYIRQKDHVLIIPDKQQIKHARTGYDLLNNLMIPNIDVDRRKGSVATLGGSVSLYINGRKVDPQEVRNLRPQDVEKVEYFDAPTGKYAGDVASINYIVKEYTSGGYITLDGNQTIGYLAGDYNAAAKLSHKNTSYSLFAGYNMQKYNNDGEEESFETIMFPQKVIIKESFTDIAKKKNDQQYAQLNIVNQNKKRTLSAKVSFVRNNIPKNYQEEHINYSAHYDDSNSTGTTRQESLMPSLNLYGNFKIKENQYLETTLSGLYTNNKYNRLYTEKDWTSLSNVNEDLYVFNPSIKYVISLKHQNTFGLQAMHYHQISSSSYTGDHSSWQHLWSGESLLFASYNHRLSNKVFVDGRIGISSLQYSLHRYDKYVYISPRANLLWGFRLSNKQQLYVGGAVGKRVCQNRHILFSLVCLCRHIPIRRFKSLPIHPIHG